MAVAGVIAEYNPFHRGHGWQLAELRARLGEDAAVVICMSGNFVQRGDFAILSKYARAEMALLGGADLVLELPAPWSAAGAERFAQGGVAVLAATGVVTCLAFGSESGSLEPLEVAAAALDSPQYHQAVRRLTGGGAPFAAVRQEAIRSLTGSAADCLSHPNDILAVEYLRALRRTDILLMALPRVGAGHDSGEESGYPSASAIREKISSGGDWKNMMPEASAGILSREIREGRAPAVWQNCQRALLARLRTMAEEDFQPYDGGNEGLYHRFYAAVHKEAAVEGILAAAKTRRYPMARLRRMLLQAYLGVPQAKQGETPPYLRVLGAGSRGRTLLAEMRRTASLPVLVKPGHIRRLGAEAQRVFDQEARCADLYALAYPNLAQAVPESEYTAAPVMLPGTEGRRRKP